MNSNVNPSIHFISDLIQIKEHIISFICIYGKFTLCRSGRIRTCGILLPKQVQLTRLCDTPLFGAHPRIRTETLWLLRPSPLPIGLDGHSRAGINLLSNSKLVDPRRIELLLSACKTDVLPLSLQALNDWWIW